MELIDDAYQEAQHVKRIAEKYEGEVDYWRLVLGLLGEERQGADPKRYAREEKRIRKTIRKNAKLARRVNRIYNRLMRRYLKRKRG